MAHFTELDNNNRVVRVIVAESKEWCEKYLFGRWIQTSYNTRGGVHLNGGTPLRKNYAGLGYTYDRERDAFIPPKPFESWVLNETACLWEAPVAMPTDDKKYSWNESTTSWDVVAEPS